MPKKTTTTVYTLTGEEVAEAIRNYVRASDLDATIPDNAEVVITLNGAEYPPEEIGAALATA